MELGAWPKNVPDVISAFKAQEKLEKNSSFIEEKERKNQ
jgi:hypothetical protein